MAGPSFQPQDVPLTLLDDEAWRELARLESKEEEEFNLEVYGERQRDLTKHYLRPPGRPDLSYREVGELADERRRRFAALFDDVKQPKSRVMVPPNAWAWNLRSYRSEIDRFAQGLLDSSELFLCKYVLRLVEAEEERIDWAALELSTEAGFIYKLWPTEQYRTVGSLTAEAGLAAKVGLTHDLDMVDLGANATAKVVWRGTWKWATAVIKAWGVGDGRAGWELERDREAPFAGERDLFLILQLPRTSAPPPAFATVRARIRPRGFWRSLLYGVDKMDAVRVQHHLG
jgi:hypothetical protein